MSQKNTPILFTLLSSVCMMVLVASLFHLPTGVVNGGIASSFFVGQKKEKLQEISQTTRFSYGSIDPSTISYLSQ